MKCIHICEVHIRFITSHFHYSTSITSVILACCALFYAYSFPNALAAAPSKEEIVTVQIDGQAQPPGFSPALLTLHMNETVTFINHAFPTRSYTLSADDGSFSSPPIPPGGQWSITFHTPGSHTYRETSATQTMVGELLVVDKSIHLLATPDPFVEATVVALIKNGQNPPNTIIIATHKHPTSSSGSIIPLIILIIGISVSVTLLSILGITYYRRSQQRTHVPDKDQTKLEDDVDNADDIDDEDDTDNSKHIQQVQAIVANLKKKLQVHQPFKAGASDDDDDNDDWTA